MKLLLVNAKQSLADSLAAYDGIDVTLLWPQKYQSGCASAATGVRRHWYAGGQRLSLRAVWQMGKILRELRPDIVHAFYGRALAHVVLAARGMRNPPEIISFRGITAPLSRLNLGDWLSLRHPLVAAHACESAAVRDSLVASGIAAEKCWVTFNSMASLPTHRPGRQALKQFGIPDGAFVVGTMATMRRVKGIDILLRAAIECAELRDVNWLLLGNIVDSEVRTLAADLRICDRVRLIAHRADASELISGADLFVMPSRAEALCQALLEAMHQGVCPVVSDAGGMKEVVRDGQDGVVVPVEDVQALANAIRDLHANRGRVAQYASAAARRVAAEFTPQYMAERCLQMYRHLASEGLTRGAA